MTISPWASMTWFKVHTGWLESESRELSSNSNYIEKLQVKERFFVSSGEIIVRLKETRRYPVLFFYPDSTPYLPPKVFILRDLLSDAETSAIAAGKKEAQSIIRSKVYLFGNLRHQNADGSLCIVERDNLTEQGIESFSAREIIKRVREWLAGIETRRMPKDSAEVELFFHFTNRVRDQRLLIPDAFFDPEIVEGNFFFVVNSLFRNLDVTSFIGLLIVGQNARGVSLPPRSYSSPNHLELLSAMSDVLIKHPVDLLTESKKVEDLVEAKILLKGSWWQLGDEPMPFTSVADFATYLGKGDTNEGMRKMTCALASPIKKHADRIYAGVRFRGRRSQFEWAFFRLDRQGTSKGAFINPTTKELADRLYEYVCNAVYAEVFTDKDYHARNASRADRTVLSQREVTLIGCGALGSEVADCLAKAGVGKIVLVDSEELRAKNSIRHLVGLDRAMIPKTLAVYEHLTLHNPFVEVIPCHPPIDITTANINQYCDIESVGISTIADDDIEAYLNEQAIFNDRTIFYSRALRGGKVARIFRVIPGHDACKNCLALYSRDNDKQFVQIPVDTTLPTIRNECNNPIRPASAADLKAISSITARKVLDHLQQGVHPNNHWIWSTEAFDGMHLPPTVDAMLISSFIGPHPECELCRREDAIAVHIDDETFESMIKECKESKEKETGGVLMGFRDRNGGIVVTRASGPGPKAIRRTDWFERDLTFCQAELEKTYNELGKRGLYVGEWHYHPTGSNKPSRQDLLSLAGISQQANYMTDRPIMLIFSSDFAVSASVHPSNRRFYFTTCRILDSVESNTLSNT